MLIDKEIRALVDDASERALAEGRTDHDELTVHTHLVRSISAAEAITELAADQNCDLVVMGTRGLTAVQELLLGSIAEAAIRRLTVPLMTTRKF